MDMKKKSTLILSFIITGAIILFFALSLYGTEKNQKSRSESEALKKLTVSHSDYIYFTYTLDRKDVPPLVADAFSHTSGNALPLVPGTQNYTIQMEYMQAAPQRIYYNKIVDQFYDEAKRKLDFPEKQRMQLEKLISSVDLALHKRYGALIPWEQAKNLFPLMSYGKVIDIQTGITFKVQRRAGSNHADVQPLTAEDTRKMKEAYGGSWSWDRRPIIVESDGHRIAASMNGMPHGAGKVKGNNFNGHFCIHFMNSTTHSGSLDPRHLRAVLQAAGKLPIKEK